MPEPSFGTADQQFYAPSSDHIQMPPFQTRENAASYVAVLSHKHIHWAPRADRLGRNVGRYAKHRIESARENSSPESGSR
ncbi:MAG: hypothetical protein GXY55_01005 [Phycisphaerae bacterium]|jgi:antirestriction protein ArdC|nr:hypothetical protein [Phycisphaerae bacterium]